jgi:hypothetical protein
VYNSRWCSGARHRRSADARRYSPAVPSRNDRRGSLSSPRVGGTLALAVRAPKLTTAASERTIAPHRGGGTLRLWVRLALDWLLYRRRHISLDSAGWYEQLALATGRGGWEVARIDGPACLLRRPRFRLP